MTAIAILLAMGVGIAMSFQSPTNASLGLNVGAMQASLISFTGGFLALLIISLIVGGGDFGAALGVPTWQLLGGIYGAAVVFSVALSSPRLGISLTLALLMLGQMLGGIVVDSFGLFMADQIPISPLRVLGCIAVLGGIICVCAGGMASGGGLASEAPAQIVGCGVLSFVAGLGSAVQLPTNSALAISTGTFEASTISFGGGVIVLLVLTLLFNKGRFNSLKGTKPWQITGGLYGAYGVSANVVATPILGVGLAMAACMFSQIIGAMAVDSLGLLRTRKVKINRYRIVGAALLLAGVALVAAAKAIA